MHPRHHQGVLRFVFFSALSFSFSPQRGAMGSGVLSLISLVLRNVYDQEVYVYVDFLYMTNAADVGDMRPIIT